MSQWENVNSEQGLYPTLDLDNEDWAEKFGTLFEDFMINTVEMCKTPPIL